MIKLKNVVRPKIVLDDACLKWFPKIPVEHHMKILAARETAQKESQHHREDAENGIEFDSAASFLDRSFSWSEHSNEGGEFWDDLYTYLCEHEED